jgi:4-amino-4-deoxy-L-arabinose transferase-like glycosyltransferase
MTARTLDKKALTTVLAICGAALILRCLFLTKQSLWLDECVSWECSAKGFWAALYCDINKPPLYYPLLHFWRAMFGSSEAALRALSIPPSVISVALMYLLGARLFSRPIGYLAAGYLAISSFQIYFAQEARNYTWLVFFLLLAGLFLWNALEAESRGRRWRYWLAYTVSIVLALYTHYFAAFFIAGHGLYVLARRRKQVIAATISIGVALAAIAPFVLIFLHSPVAAQEQTRRYPWLKLPQAYFTFLFGESLIPQDDQAVRHIVQTLRANAWIGVLIAVTLPILAIFVRATWRRWREPMVYCTFHALVPVGLTLAVSLKKGFFDRRYMIPASPWLYLLIAAVVWEVILLRRSHSEPRWRTSAGLAAVAGFCVLLAVSLYQYYFAERFGKEQWRDAVAYIEASSSVDGKDLVILDPDYLQLCYRCYQKRGLTFWAMMPDMEQMASVSEGMLRERVRGYHRVWLVYSHNDNSDLLAALRRLYPEKATREFPLANPIEVYGFDVTD